MKRHSIGIPAGFRDVLFEEATARRSLENSMAAVFENHGFREILPSGVESLEVYQRGHQSVLERAFRFLDRNDNLLALRADFTPAIARIASSRLAGEPLPVRVWYSGNVFRKVDGKHRGYAEFPQIGAELLGNNSVAGDAEILRLALECLAATGLTNIQLHLNHAGVFRGIVNALGLEGKDLRSVKSELDRKDARGLAERLQSLGVSATMQSEIHLLVSCVGGRDVLTRARAAITNPETQKAIDHLLALERALARWSGNIVFDLAELDEMEYYTGIMASFLSPALNREVGIGGRYDDLMKEFGRDIPAVGFSFSMDSLVELR